MKRKKMRTAFVSAISACILSLNLSVQTVAADYVPYTLLGGHLNNNSENMTIHVPTSALWSTWGTHVLHATTRWGSTNNVSIGWNSTPTYAFNIPKSVMVSAYSAANGANAHTTFYTFTNYQNIQVPYTQKWDYGHVQMNNYYLSNESTTKKNTVMLHEFGHVLGLGENNTNQDSIMCQEAYGRRVTYLTTGDYQGVRVIYGNN